jgi:proteasome lid subunit RPN8/RPN11
MLLPTPKFSTIESRVVELPNRSLTPTEEYIIYPADIRLAIAGWAEEATREQRNAISVWHTHPSGNIGPSIRDMRKKIDGGTYLVVAFTADGPVPCWF